MEHRSAMPNFGHKCTLSSLIGAAVENKVPKCLYREAIPKLLEYLYYRRTILKIWHRGAMDYSPGIPRDTFLQAG